MSNESMGRLPNAPLAYLLAQVRYEPILELQTAIPTVQSALRAEYPRFREIRQQTIDLTAGGVLPQATSLRWEFSNSSKTIGVILQANSLVLHATEYSTYDDFGERLSRVLSELGKLVPHILVSRVGLRYIDFLMPKATDKLEDYVSKNLGCKADPGLPYKAHTGLALMQFTLDEGLLVIRFTRASGRPTLPPDLGADLSESEVMRRPFPEKSDSAVLDWDRFVEISMPFEPAALRTKFDGLHEDISKAFKALTTDYARRVWNEGVGGKQ